ncbi:hypothetical protein FHW36_11841 [Chitinophaga polysaccharea]|uniref:Uncharacterized protein n=1 Tax=Chitinophaga polysaccharea TaxID=1293035 RepID=A0A561P0U1_9BACT|nr:hypothetical protein [Chitinophaga polysaccharea]TWF31747.1 hypothetical protein FHW36_11841 [Chitinophaga polysaccharea]
MEKRKVRKGLEAPLVVYGLRQPHFSQFLLAVAIGVAIVISNFTAALHAVPRQWGRVLLGLLVVGGALIALYMIFLARSQRKKHSFPKKESIISNRDLDRYLKL